MNFSPILNMLLDAVLGLLGMCFLFRFWMNAARVRAPASIGNFLLQMTNWLVMPLRKIVPARANIDWATLIGVLLTALVFTVIKLLLITPDFAIANNFPLLMAVGLLGLLLAQWLYYAFFAALLCEVILSWVNPHSSILTFVRELNAPVLRPIQRIIPTIGGIDLSPLIAFLLLKVIYFVVQNALGQMMIGAAI